MKTLQRLFDESPAFEAVVAHYVSLGLNLTDLDVQDTFLREVYETEYNIYVANMLKSGPLTDDDYTKCDLAADYFAWRVSAALGLEDLMFEPSCTNESIEVYPTAKEVVAIVDAKIDLIESIQLSRVEQREAVWKSLGIISEKEKDYQTRVAKVASWKEFAYA